MQSETEGGKKRQQRKDGVIFAEVV